jgi:hypothetical protein
MAPLAQRRKETKMTHSKQCRVQSTADATGEKFSKAYDLACGLCRKNSNAGVDNNVQPAFDYMAANRQGFAATMRTQGTSLS